MKIYAHRGGAGVGPENTLLAIRRVVAFEIDGIEVDVRADRAGDLVVIHDVRVDRTTGAKGQVSDYTLGEIQNLNAGAGERIPTLRSVIELAKANDLEVLLDLKSEGDADLARSVVAAVKEQSYLEASLFSSFSAATVALVKKLEPGAVSGIIISFRSRHFITGDLSSYDFISVRASAALLNPFILGRARRAGCEVFAWFGRFEPRWLVRLMVALGVDGLIVGHVGRALEVSSH